MPMMAGFVMGQMMNGGGYGGGYGGRYVGHPVFFALGGGYRAPAFGPESRCSHALAASRAAASAKPPVPAAGSVISAAAARFGPAHRSAAAAGLARQGRAARPDPAYRRRRDALLGRKRLLAVRLQRPRSTVSRRRPTHSTTCACVRSAMRIDSRRLADFGYDETTIALIEQSWGPAQLAADLLRPFRPGL